MTSGNNRVVPIRKATSSDLEMVKRLADQNKEDLGFVLRPALEKSISDNELFVSERNGIVTGFVHYHHRRDQQTTLYHIAVCKTFRRMGAGIALVNALRDEAMRLEMTHILLKCPNSAPANLFYPEVGFSLSHTEEGKKRPLNVWIMQLR